MPTLLLLFIIMLLLIFNSSLVITGARYGLLLWYRDVLPLLLPFMLISSIIEDNIHKIQISGKNEHRHLPMLSLICMGIFCGYPIGAKTAAYYIDNNLITKRMGNILLPLCNNISPMFFIGYILTNKLNGNISILKGYACLYIPFLIFFAFDYFAFPKKEHMTNVNCSTYHSVQKKAITEACIIQITFTGLYIMLCSIAIEFIINNNLISQTFKLFLTGITEVTRGVDYIAKADLFDEKIKTALILSCTSFGGISSIMQTNKYLKSSGLSLIHYIIIKVLCAITTFFLCLLII